MTEDTKIAALLTLIDDPDVEVFDTVAERLLNYGKEIIPRLEGLWESTVDERVQERIETLIHRVHFRDLQEDFYEWRQSRHPEILRGAILVAKHHFPDLNVGSILSQFDQMRRNIWLELNAYLTPLEQVNVFNSILYNYYKLKGMELSELEPKHFFINQVLESRQGNAFSIGILYLALCELLDVPVFAVNIPRQFIFAYIDSMHSFISPDAHAVQQVSFYIDPLNGMVYTQTEVDAYLHKIKAAANDYYAAPLTPVEIIYRMLEDLSLCYKHRGEDEKADEIILLMKIVAGQPEEGDEEED